MDGKKEKTMDFVEFKTRKMLLESNYVSLSLPFSDLLAPNDHWQEIFGCHSSENTSCSLMKTPDRSQFCNLLGTENSERTAKLKIAILVDPSKQSP